MQLAGYVTPQIFSAFPELVAIQSTRVGGVSSGAFASLNVGHNTTDNPTCVLENRERLCAALGIEYQNLVTADQVHGTNIYVAYEAGHYSGYDAFITNQPNRYLCIFTADCYPVLLYDPHHKAVAAIHAGWKGSAGKIVLKTLHAMQTHFGTVPGNCLAYIGAGISGSAYEVGMDVAHHFANDVLCSGCAIEGTNEHKALLDLRKENYRQLLEAGIPSMHIEQSPYCTFRESDLFFSYRRDNGVTGRMVALIGLRH
uniref:Purine nucleoside phosphorylase n=1 Tax=Chlorobium chlorochromatii (strain CaD3) TaxID=340177 RepID=Q3ANW9_CHLCH